VDAQIAWNHFRCRELPILRTIPCEVPMSIQDPLPAPERMDAPAIRPALNLSHMLQQVRGIQTFLAGLRKKDK
jgi:hypothetical protein